METALKDPRKTEINSDFHVSTALFSSRFETRIFSELDELPTELVNILSRKMSATMTLDIIHVTPETGYHYDDAYADDDDYEGEAYVSGYTVESYGFTDARNVHDAVVEAVKVFVTTHTRTVTYS